MAQKLKKGDEVVVISGELSDRRGNILEIDRNRNRVRVEGVSKGKKRTVKKSAQNPQGGLVDRIESIHASNVMLASKYDERQKKREGAAN